MTCLKEFASSVEKNDNMNPTVRRWLNSTRALELQMSESIVYLCAYYDRIPEQSQTNYADVLVSVLRSGDLEPGFIESHNLAKNISDFATYLENSDIPECVSRGAELRETVTS
jgi:hypothetical protein